MPWAFARHSLSAHLDRDIRIGNAGGCTMADAASRLPTAARSAYLKSFRVIATLVPGGAAYSPLRRNCAGRVG